ncbi:MAG: EF-hand domain-containing protein [Rhodospirillaceae bacterium]|nr:EF-hand domain-containing protein [Rhodospirillales bacterium]
MRIPASLFAAVLALPVAAHAQMGTSKPGMAAVATFKGFDRNGDGGLSRAELNARGKEKGSDALFVLMDGDGDGRLSLKEFTGAGSGPLLGRFDAYDVDKNGYIVRREFPNFVDPRLVAALDRNRDRRISLAEIRPAFGGSRVMTAKAEAEPARRKAAPPPQRQSWCWVTGFGDAQWIVEGPVTFDGCR